MKKLSKKELEEVLFTIDADDVNDPDESSITLYDVLHWTVNKLLYKGDEIQFNGEEGQKYSIVVSVL